MRRLTAAAALAFVIVVFGGCSATRDRKQVARYEDELRPQVGEATVETFVKQWGTPTQRIDVPNGEMWCWRISHGSRSGGVGYILSVGQSYEQYDDIRLKFDEKHILREFTVECMR